MSGLKLKHNLSFEDLYARDGLEKVDAAFVADLKQANVDLHNRFVEARLPDGKEESDLLIELAPYLEDFIAGLFGIEKEVRALNVQHNELADIYVCKRLFVQRRAEKICKPDEAVGLDEEEVTGYRLQVTGKEPSSNFEFEKAFAQNVVGWLNEKGLTREGFEDKVEVAAKYASWALNSDAGRAKHKVGVLFKKPRKTDFQNLVAVETEIIDGVTVKRLPKHDLRYREGFALTDTGATLAQALDDANYCIYCHNQGKDSCAKGLREKPDENGKTPFKKTPLNIPQAGCPLEEKISEMNNLKANGYSIGALGVVAVDNPLCAATGHRICNDCMKSCIYQKQDPVNIPQTETRILQDVLDLPWGFEIYSLLSRWNPLNLARPLPRPDSGYKVLIAGLGPAGFNLAHHLMNDGHIVVGVDGLKIEPLPEEISGITALGERVPFKPVENIQDLFENLGERVLAGFGGVAEYGITVRWNKNYLKVIRLLLERRQNFRMYGGVRFGSTISYNQAWKLGFDHIALCLGAGKPTVVSMPNAMARGVRTASDFLMALQLTGAAKHDSIANLQLRLPVVVIGGGLTAVDAATESLAYYPLQVEKFLARYEILVEELGEDTVRKRWSGEETEIAEEFITHAKAIREERQKAEAEGRTPDILGLLRRWGGATVAYRRRLVDSPSYRLNHEEVEKAMEEGIDFAENATPAGVNLDKHGHADGLRVNYPVEAEDGRIETRERILPARTVFMAAGTSPNTVLAREDAHHFELDGKWFAAVDEDGNPVTPEPNTSKPETPDILMSKDDNGKFVSYFGDLHPSYVGNVVKAMGSAKQGYPLVSKVMAKTSPLSDKNAAEFFAELDDKIIARVHDVIRLTPNIIEVVVKAPLAAQQFQPGQFYRLQNYEYFAMENCDGGKTTWVFGKEKTESSTVEYIMPTTLAMEGLALTGAWVDKEAGLLSTIVLEMGGSSDLCAFLDKGEPVILMGPTGTPTHIPQNETVMLVGGGLGNAVLFSIGKACKDAGSKVLYFAGYKQKQDRYKVEEIEKASDVIVWCCDEGEFTPERKGDKTFHGNIVQAMEAYATGALGDTPINMPDVSHIVTIGSDRMMAAVKNARHTVLKDYLQPQHEAIGSINSPMQCMMKEICAQCLQRHIDPETGERTYVYSCFNQDQCLDKVDFPHLNERLKQNSVQEKLTALWINRSLQMLGLRD